MLLEGGPIGALIWRMPANIGPNDPPNDFYRFRQGALPCWRSYQRHVMRTLGNNFCVVALLTLTSCAAVRQFPDDPAATFDRSTLLTNAWMAREALRLAVTEGDGDPSTFQRWMAAISAVTSSN